MKTTAAHPVRLVIDHKRAFLCALYLGCILGAALFCLTHYSARPAVPDFLSSLIPELFGIGLTVLVLDWLSARARRLEKAKLALLPAKRIRGLITMNLGIWVLAYKACLKERPADPPFTPEAFIRCDPLRELIFLDFNKFAGFEIDNPRGNARWIDLLGKYQWDISQQALHVVDSYGHLMPAEMLEGLASLLECSIWREIAKKGRRINAQFYRQGEAPDFCYLARAGDGVPASFRTYLARMQHLLDMCVAPDYKGAFENYNHAWGADGPPAYGSGQVSDPLAAFLATQNL